MPTTERGWQRLLTVVLICVATSAATARGAAADVVIDEARVCAGIHVRHDQAAGRELGRRVGEHVCRTAFRPLGGKPAECRP